MAHINKRVSAAANLSQLFIPPPIPAVWSFSSNLIDLEYRQAGRETRLTLTAPSALEKPSTKSAREIFS